MHAQPLESLTDREREILACLAQKLSNQEIADKLYLSVKTVKWYNTQIFEKLGVRNRAGAIRHFTSDTPPAILPKTTFPVQATPFIGREREVDDLAALLQDANVRIITILAPGGMGKTHLAIETAIRHAEPHTSPACFVSLAQISSPADLVTAIGSAAGLNFFGAREAKEQLFDFLRVQELLLVLDNFEHLLEGAPLVAEIVAAAPNVKILITSREKLNLSGETLYRLGGMNVPESAANPLAFDSVQLFLHHAHRVHRDFRADDPASITRIAKLTGGMPLGLVLAGAWTDVLSPMQIADEISRGMDVLQQELRDVPMRHRSIRAVFDPTWEWLSEVQREVFMKLSVFRGGFTHEAAQAVAGADLRMLSILAGKSLIQPQQNQRYTIHELLRQYGESHLNASGATSAAQAAHSAFFIDFLAQREEDVKGKRQIHALREISDDFENIRKGWLWALAHKHFDAIDRALECLVIAGESTDRLLETRAILQQSAAIPDIHGQILWERIVVRLARLDHTLRNEVDLGVMELILERARQRDDGHEMAWCLWVMAEREAMVNGRDWQARLLFEELIALCQKTGNDYFRAHALANIAWRYANHGEVERGIAALRESIAIRQKIGALKNLDFPASQLGWFTFDLLQDIQGGEALLDEQITSQNQSGTTSVLTLILGMKALMAFWQYDFDATLKLARRGIEIARNQNYLGGLSLCQGALGLVEIRSGDNHQGRLICQEVERSGFSNLTAFPAHWVLSFASYALGEEAVSRERLKRAMQIACRYKSPTFQGMSLLLVTLLQLDKRDPQQAVEYLGFCFSQPPHLTKWLHGWSLLDELAANLQAQLDPDIYAAAWARGQTLDLNTAAAKQLAEL